MKLNIRFVDPINKEDSINLTKLANLIEDNFDVDVQVQERPPQVGEKDGGFAIALAISGLALTAIQTLISTLDYWRSKQEENDRASKYSVVVIIQNTTVVSNDNFLQEDTQMIIDAISSSSLQEIQIQILKPKY